MGTTGRTVSGGGSRHQPISRQPASGGESRRQRLLREIGAVEGEIAAALNTANRNLPQVGMRRTEVERIRAANNAASREASRLWRRLWKLRQDLQSEIQRLGLHEVTPTGEFLTVGPTAPLSGHPRGSYFVSYGQRGTGNHVTIVYNSDGCVIEVKPT